MIADKTFLTRNDKRSSVDMLPVPHKLVYLNGKVVSTFRCRFSVIELF
jgi:hypothetical protein